MSCWEIYMSYQRWGRNRLLGLKVGLATEFITKMIIVKTKPIMNQVRPK